jgi:hypothetical protein
MSDIKTVQALVEALMKLRKAADARGYDLMDNSYPQKYWYALRDQADSALDAGCALIEQMQREAVQPVAEVAGDPEDGPSYIISPALPVGTTLYAAPQPAQASDRVEQIQPVHSTRASGVCASTTPLTEHTIVVRFPEGVSPRYRSGMEVLGGTVVAVDFGGNRLDVATELQEVLEEILADGVHCDVVPHLQRKARAAIDKANEVNP